VSGDAAYPATYRQFGRFLLVGATNTALSFVVYRLLLVITTPYLLAAPLAFAVGALNGYIFNSRWTFAAHDTIRARLLYVLVVAVGSASATLLVLAFAQGAGTGKVLAYVAALPPVAAGTFLANRRWTFADRATPCSPADSTAGQLPQNINRTSSLGA
jgi:putative flippase GtrA